MRCKQCLQVIRHPCRESKIIQICGVCRKLMVSVGDLA
jgi:hypothetical protein